MATATKVDHCRSCGAPIHWTTTPGGRLMPMDVDPATGEVGATHFATCPQRDKWRKPRTGARQ